MRRIAGVAVLVLLAMGALKPGRQFARAYQEIEASGVRAGFVERVALSLVVAGTTNHRPPCAL